MSLNPQTDGTYASVVLSTSDYYPFGMAMAERTYSNSEYRYGFNGKENDSDFGSHIQDYGFRLYSRESARFLSIDPLSPSYPFYTPYQFAGNKPIRFIDLDGLEEANPSAFTKALNFITGDHHLNRMNQYLTDHQLTSDNVISLINDTYVVTRQVEQQDGCMKTVYSVFRKAKSNSDPNRPILLTSSENDNVDLSHEDFLNLDYLIGNKGMDSPFGGGAIKGTKIVISGGKNSLYIFRQSVAVAKQGKKSLKAWKDHIKIGIPDVTGISGDVLKKGFHLHFKKLGNLELTLKPSHDGKLILGYLLGSEDKIADAVKVFNEALGNKEFREHLLIKLKAYQDALNSGKKVLSNADDVKMANDRAIEINFLIKTISNSLK